MQLFYQGVDIYPKISVSQCWHDEYAGGHVDEVTLVLNDNRMLWDTWSPKADDEISIVEGNSKTGKLFVHDVVPEAALLTIRARSAPRSFRNINNKSWEQVKLFGLISEIAGRHGLTVETHDVEDHLYAYVSQNHIPDMAFLAVRCALEGLSYIVYDGKLVVFSESAMEKQAALLTISLTKGSNYKIIDDGFELYGSAVITNGTATGTYQANNGSGRVFRESIPIAISDAAEATRFAKGMLRQENKDKLGVLINRTHIIRDIAAGSVVNLTIEGADSRNGNYFISRVRQDYVNNTSKIWTRKPLEGY